MPRTRASAQSPAEPAQPRATRSRARQTEAEGSNSPQQQRHTAPDMNKTPRSKEDLARFFGEPARRAAPRTDHISFSQVTVINNDDDNESVEGLTQTGPLETVVEYSMSTDATTNNASAVDPTVGEPSQAALPPPDSQAPESQDQQTIELRTACLTDLKDESCKLFERIFNKPANKALWDRLVEMRRQAFLDLWRVYAEPDEPFIAPVDTARTVKPEFTFQARGIFALANLVRVLDQLSTTRQAEPGFFEDQAQLLDKYHFPADLTPWTFPERLEDVDVEEALNVRTQSLIAALEKSPDEDAVGHIPAWVAAFFCRSPDDSRIVPENILSICGLEEPMPVEIADKCCRRAASLLEMAEGTTSAEVASSLRRHYPLDKWRADTIDWAYTRFTAIRGDLEAPSTEEVSQPGDDVSSAPSGPSQPVVRPLQPSKPLAFDRDTIAWLMGKGPASPARQHVHATPPPASDGGGEPSAPPPMSDDHYNKLMADRAAERIVQSSGGPAAAATPKKRTREQSEADDDDDEDPFQEDARQPDEQRRAELDRQAMPPPAKRFAPSDPSPPSAQQPQASRAESEATATPAPSATPAEPDFRAISQKNRARAAPQPGGIQRRVPWCNADTSKLIQLIAEHHCVWAKIYEAANVVEKPGKPVPEYDPSRHFQDHRNQQAIRDKARNLKVDFLKADLVLPQGFDGIILGKKERAAILARGKNPDRLENDIDEDGRPTNTSATDEELFMSD